MLTEIDELGDGLTEWEIEFVESMTKLANRSIPFSAAQANRIEKIHEDRVD